MFGVVVTFRYFSQESSFFRSLLGAGCSIVLLRLGFGIGGLIGGSCVTCATLQVVNVFIVRTANLPLRQHARWDNFRFHRLVRFGGGVLGGSLLSMMLSPFNRLILARFAGLSTIPIYDIAYLGSFKLRALVESAIRAIMPEISRVGVTRNAAASSKIHEINRRAYILIFSGGSSCFFNWHLRQQGQPYTYGWGLVTPPRFQERFESR